MEEDFTYAGILLEVQSDGMLLVALPEAAGELWPGTPFGSVPDCTPKCSTWWSTPSLRPL